jgi:hypothetical protein
MEIVDTVAEWLAGVSSEPACGSDGWRERSRWPM